MSRLTRFLVVILVLAALMFPLTAAAGVISRLFSGNVPAAADSIADQLDEQLMDRFAQEDGDADVSRGTRESLTRARIVIMCTTPANINNLEEASPLARQMMEEVSTKLMDKGYRIQELRKGRDIRFDRQRGEFLLTHDVQKLLRKVGRSHAVMAGTFVTTPKQVRFSIRLIHTPGTEVLAMGSATVNITEDLKPLLRDKPARGGRGGANDGGGVVPTVRTRLQ